MHALIEASNISAAGPRALMLSLLPALMRSMDEWNITLHLPDTHDFRQLFINDRTQVLYWKTHPNRLNNLFRIKRLYWDIPRIANKLNPDVILTLGDLGALGLHCPNVIFLHNSYFVYSRSEVYNSNWPWLKYKFMTEHFARTLRSAKCVIVQTPIMAQRLASRYSILPHRIVQIPQPVPQHIPPEWGCLSRYEPIQTCGKSVRLLFLSSYYPHKNHAILPSVANELRRRGLSSKVHIFTTLGKEQQKWRSLQKVIDKYPDVITNLGRLSSSDVANALNSSSALFLPTVVESYGLIYLEAMACGIPIITSDRDFARWMCRDMAFYFDPLDAKSIVDAIEIFIENMQLINSQKAKELLARFPKDWDEVAHRFTDVLCASAGSSDAQ